MAYEVSLSRISLIKDNKIEEKLLNEPNIVSGEEIKGIFAI